eukprot:SAG31_NODE_14595_length_797_cov_1.521490_2_plen_174_part_01
MLLPLPPLGGCWAQAAQVQTAADAKYREIDQKYHLGDKAEAAAAAAQARYHRYAVKAQRLQHGQAAEAFALFAGLQSSGADAAGGDSAAAAVSADGRLDAAGVAGFFARCGLELTPAETDEALAILRQSVHFEQCELAVEMPPDTTDPTFGAATVASVCRPTVASDREQAIDDR